MAQSENRAKVLLLTADYRVLGEMRLGPDGTLWDFKHRSAGFELFFRDVLQQIPTHHEIGQFPGAGFGGGAHEPLPAAAPQDRLVCRAASVPRRAGHAAGHEMAVR